MELVNPRILNYINGWLEWSNYTFTEHKQENAGSQGQGQDLKLTPTLADGAAITGSVSLTQSAGQANHAVLFTADAGNLANVTFMVVDINGTAGYQANADLVVRLDNHTGSLTTGNFS